MGDGCGFDWGFQHINPVILNFTALERVREECLLEKQKTVTKEIDENDDNQFVRDFFQNV